MPNSEYEATPVYALYQNITKEIYCIPSRHREEGASHGIGPNQKNFYQILQPNETVWTGRKMYSKARTIKRRSTRRGS